MTDSAAAAAAATGTDTGDAGTQSGGEQTPIVKAGEPSPPDVIEARREEVAKELAEAQKALAAASKAEAKPPEGLQRIVELLQKTDLAYEQQLVAMEYGAELARMRQEMEAELSRLKRMYSDLALENLAMKDLIEKKL